jgi:hypothetical protein
MLRALKLTFLIVCNDVESADLRHSAKQPWRAY